MSPAMYPRWSALVGLSVPRLSLSAWARSGAFWFFPVQTGDLTIKADSQAKRNLLIIGGTVALGAAIAVRQQEERVPRSAQPLAVGQARLALTSQETRRSWSHRRRCLRSTFLPSRSAPLNWLGSSPPRLRASRLSRITKWLNPIPSLSSVAVTTITTTMRTMTNMNTAKHHYRERYLGAHNVFFISDHRAKVAIFWPERTEYIYLRGDDLDDILNPLSNRMHISVAVIRPRIIVREDDDD